MRKYLKVVYSGFLFLFLINSGYAQGSMMDKMKAKAEETLKKTKELLISKELVVVLLEENQEVLNKLQKKPEKLANYKEVINNYNQFIQEHATEYLSFIKAVKFIKVSELESIPWEERMKYNYLCFNDIKFVSDNSFS